MRCKVVGDYLDAGIGDIPGLRAEIWVHKEDVAAARRCLTRAATGETTPARTRQEEE